jgi:hypothetical protein
MDLRKAISSYLEAVFRNYPEGLWKAAGNFTCNSWQHDRYSKQVVPNTRTASGVANTQTYPVNLRMLATVTNEYGLK